jgi:hypothetical protein
MSYIALHTLSGSHYYWSCCYSPFHPHFTPFHMKGAWLRENNGLLETQKSTIENLWWKHIWMRKLFLDEEGWRKEGRKGGWSFGWRIIITLSTLILACLKHAICCWDKRFPYFRVGRSKDRIWLALKKQPLSNRSREQKRQMYPSSSREQ